MQVSALSFILVSLSATLNPTTLPTSSVDAVLASQNIGLYKAVAGSDALQKLVGHVPPLTQVSEQGARLASEQTMTLSFALPYSNESELRQLIADQADAHSENYRKYLTPEQFAARFHPSAAQVEQTNAFLRAHRMTPESQNGLFVRATGAVADIEALLHTEMYNYTAPNGREFFAPAFEVQLPQGSIIQAVMGLSNAARPHHHAVQLKAAATGKSTYRAHSFTAAGVRQAYNIPQAADGNGQTLALLELDGYAASDIRGYAKANNLPVAKLKNVIVDNYNGAQGDGAGEVTLDIEVMMALAPNANILVYEAPNAGSGMSDIWNEMANPTKGEGAPAIISCSWGIAESELTRADVRADNSVFMQMAAQGQTVFSAAGDSGAFDDGYTLSVDEPAAQPYVIGVGGTALYVDSKGNYLHESTWAGGGGGISRYWAPMSWQKNVLGTGSNGSTTHRNVPDVSLAADPNTGYNIYFQGGWTVFGGTSCAAPLWAAFEALVNQNRAQAGLAPIGFMAPALYNLGRTNSQTGVFHDVNDNTKNGYYPAVTGYDDATGWGSFNGQAMMQALTK
jgi:kumamolisin